MRAHFKREEKARAEAERLAVIELEQANAAVVLEETRLDEVWLVDTICALLEDPSRLARMSDAARAMSHPNASKEIAELAAKVAGVGTTP